MPKLHESAVPSYRLHKQSGQAIVTLNKRDVLLGKFNSIESRTKYNRLIGEWLAGGRQLPAEKSEMTIAELVVAYRKHTQTYYRDGDGILSRAVENIDEALKPVVMLYADTAAAEFGPLRLKAVRESMIASGRVRTNINRHIIWVRGMFKWAVEQELIPASVHHGLMAVSGLRRGRCEVKESEPIKPVLVEYVDATLPHVSAQVAAMIRLQLLTGMRPGEVVLMRGIDLDTTGKLWVYRPSKHKTAIHGHTRDVYMGPKAQAILRGFLKPDLSAYLFSPADAEAARRQALHMARKTPMSCGNKPGTNKRRKPKHQPGVVYTVETYYRAVQRGCNRADDAAKDGVVSDERIIPRWHPHQLRHTAATALRKRYGLEAAQVALGHKTLSVTELYAEKNIESAMKIAAEVG